MADKKLDILINIVKKLAGLDDTKKGIIGIGKESEKAGKKGDKSWKKLEKRLKSINKGLKTGIKTTLKWGKQLATSATAAAAGLGALAVNAAKFNIQIGRAQSMADNMGFFKMRQQALDLSNAVGVASSEISNGLYQALSGGVPEENVFSFVETAAKVAVADCSDVATAVDGLTTVLNAFGVDSSEADKVADAMFKTVANGKTTFADLAQNLSTCTSVANGLGVSYNEVLAAAATLTKGGSSTAEAMTGIKQAMLGLNRQLGDGWAKTYTLQEALEKVARESGYSSTAITKAFGQEGVTGVLGLVGDNAKRAKADLEDMADAVGAVNEAHAKVDIHRTWDKAWIAVQNLVQQVGNIINETIKPDIEAITEKINSWTSDTTLWDSLKEKLGEVRELVIGLWEAVESGQGQKVYEAIGDLLMGYIHRGGELAGAALKKIAPEVGDILGKAALAAMNPLADHSAALQKTREQFGGTAYNALPWKVERSDEFKAALAQNKQGARQERLQSYLGSSQSGLTAAQKEIEEGWSKLNKLAEKGAEEFKETTTKGATQAEEAAATTEERYNAAGEKVQVAQQNYIAKIEEYTDAGVKVGEKLFETAEDFTEGADTYQVAFVDGNGNIISSMQTGAEEMTKASEGAAKQIEEKAEATATDVQAGADLVVKAADDMSTKIGEGLKKQGDGIQTMANTINGEMARTNELLGTTYGLLQGTLKALNQQLRALESQVNSQAVETDIVKRQLASMQ